MFNESAFELIHFYPKKYLLYKETHMKLVIAFGVIAFLILVMIICKLLNLESGTAWKVIGSSISLGGYAAIHVADKLNEWGESC